jgi:hypothetical protein
MLFCHLGRAQSLREIEGGLAASEGKLQHLGVKAPPKRSTLAYANAHRPWQVFQTVFTRLYGRFSAEIWQHCRRRFRFRHKLLSLDATLIPLCISLFDWAQYRRSKGAVKLHLVLDHDGWLPQFAVVTPGKTADIEVARRLRFEPGTLLVFDRGYQDYAWWMELTRQGVFFITRLKDNAEYGVVEQRPADHGRGIVRDEVILLVRLQQQGPEALMRRIEVEGEDGGTVVFVTNHLKLSAATVAAVYRERWQIELLFKVYRPRFLGQFFELSSCGSLEGKQGVVSLPRGLEAEPFDQPLVVVALAKFFERFGQLLQRFEVPHPEKLLLEGAEEAFDAAVAFRLADEGR